MIPPGTFGIYGGLKNPNPKHTTTITNFQSNSGITSGQALNQIQNIQYQSQQLQGLQNAFYGSNNSQLAQNQMQQAFWGYNQGIPVLPSRFQHFHNMLAYFGTKNVYKILDYK